MPGEHFESAERRGGESSLDDLIEELGDAIPPKLAQFLQRVVGDLHDLDGRTSAIEATPSITDAVFDDHFFTELNGRRLVVGLDEGQLMQTIAARAPTTVVLPPVTYNPPYPDKYCSCDSGDSGDCIYLDAAYASMFFANNPGVTPVLRVQNTTDSSEKCYALDTRNVNVAFTQNRSVLEAYVNCETCNDEEPLPGACPADPPLRLRIANYSDGDLGQFQADVGAGCVALTDSGSHTRWDGAGMDYFMNCIWLTSGNIYIGNDAAEVQATLPSPRVDLVVGEGWYFRFNVDSYAFVWRKTGGTTPAGTYTLVPSTDTGTYQTTPGVCTNLLAQTVTIEKY